MDTIAAVTIPFLVYLLLLVFLFKDAAEAKTPKSIPLDEVKRLISQALSACADRDYARASYALTRLGGLVGLKNGGR